MIGENLGFRVCALGRAFSKSQVGFIKIETIPCAVSSLLRLGLVRGVTEGPGPIKTWQLHQEKLLEALGLFQNLCSFHWSRLCGQHGAFHDLISPSVQFEKFHGFDQVTSLPEYFFRD